ncbi:hypothetical protein F5X99DRAFT_388307 [Biscogniauxia marginata]|nr:hypothetical protein F5X99DRAFT_388307 [Biscogniauxia marginata]
MVTFNLSYTAPINPPDVETKLTISQVWACINSKVRHAEKFVPAIVNTEILSESATDGAGLVLERRVTFAPGGHPAGAKDAVETCKFYEPCRVDFVSADGSIITNVVSVGPSGKSDDLHYTYVFEWRHPGIEANSSEAESQKEADWKTARLAVESTIETMRRLVRESAIL